MPQIDGPEVTRALTQQLVSSRALGGAGPVKIIGYSSAEIEGNEMARILQTFTVEKYGQHKAQKKAHKHVKLRRQTKGRFTDGRKRRYIVIRHTESGGQENEEPTEGGQE